MTTSGIDVCVDTWLAYARRPDVHYCNETWRRCSDPNCKDCSTFAAMGLNAGFTGSCNPCIDSFDLAAWCFNMPRPAFFTKRFGPGQGTFITYDQAQHVVSLGFRGTDFGKRPDSTGDGHVEELLGIGTASVGAHSHATGIHEDPNGINNHQLSYFAVPPCFLPEMAGPPIDRATLEAIVKLTKWQHRCTVDPLEWKQTNGDVTTLNQLLILRGFIKGTKYMNTYTYDTRRGVHRLKVVEGLVNKDGRRFGADAAPALLAA